MGLGPLTRTIPAQGVRQVLKKRGSESALRCDGDRGIQGLDFFDTCCVSTCQDSEYVRICTLKILKLTPLLEDHVHHLRISHLTVLTS
jgi:hypothetical protein